MRNGTIVWRNYDLGFCSAKQLQRPMFLDTHVDLTNDGANNSRTYTNSLELVFFCGLWSQLHGPA